MADRERLICASRELVDSGDGVRFEIRVDGATEPAFAVRYKGRVYAYRNRCAHLPMELDWKPGKFFDSEGLLLICSTHGAVYRPETGECLGGPCEGALVPVPIEEREGGIVLKENDDVGR